MERAGHKSQLVMTYAVIDRNYLTFLYCFFFLSFQVKRCTLHGILVSHINISIVQCYAKQYYQTIEVIRLERILQRLALTRCVCGTPGMLIQSM